MKNSENKQLMSLLVATVLLFTLGSQPASANETTIVKIDQVGSTTFTGVKHLTELRGKLYFRATQADNTDVDVFEYDPTADIVTNLDLRTGNGNSPEEFSIFGDNLVFSGLFPEGRELYMYSPASGALTSADINTSSSDASSSPKGMTEVGGLLYFTADEGLGNGRQLFSWDGASAPVSIDIGGSDPKGLFAYQEKLYLAASTDAEGQEVHVYNPTGASITRISSIGGTDDIFNFGDRDGFIAFQDRIFFGAEFGTVPIYGDSKAYLYSLDPEATDDTTVQEIKLEGTAESRIIPDFFEVFQDKLFFRASNADTLENELHSYDETNGATLTVNIDLSGGDGDPSWMTTYNGRLYFRGEPTNSYKVMSYDGQSADVIPGSPTNPAYLTVVGSDLYFVAGSNNLYKLNSPPPAPPQSSGGSSTPPPYTGPLISGISEGSGATFNSSGTDTVTFTGERLGTVTKAFINGIEAEVLSTSNDEFEVSIPEGLEPGTYDLEIQSSAGNLTYLDAITIVGTTSIETTSYGEVTAWTSRISDTQVKVYVKFPTVGEKVRISHQTGGSGSYETIYVKTTSSENMEGLRIVEGVGTYVVRTIDLASINRIRVTVGDEELVQVRYNN